MAFGGSKSLPLAFAVVATVTLLHAHAGYVELFKDADYQNKLETVNGVKPMYCYNIVCDRLNDVVSSARWGNLPEVGNMYKNKIAMIKFWESRDCDKAVGKARYWPVKTQSVADLAFPSNFRLDSMDDAISSFMVMTEGKSKGKAYVCMESATLAATNETLSVITVGGSIAGANETGEAEEPLW